MSITSEISKAKKIPSLHKKLMHAYKTGANQGVLSAAEKWKESHTKLNIFISIISLFTVPLLHFLWARSKNAWNEYKKSGKEPIHDNFLTLPTHQATPIIDGLKRSLNHSIEEEEEISGLPNSPDRKKESKVDDKKSQRILSQFSVANFNGLRDSGTIFENLHGRIEATGHVRMIQIDRSSGLYRGTLYTKNFTIVTSQLSTRHDVATYKRFFSASPKNRMLMIDEARNNAYVTLSYIIPSETDLREMSLIITLKGDTEKLTCCAYYKDRNKQKNVIASTNTGHVVMVSLNKDYTYTSMQRDIHVDLEKGPIQTIAPTPSGDYFASLHENGELCLWNTSNIKYNLSTKPTVALNSDVDFAKETILDMRFTSKNDLVVLTSTQRVVFNNIEECIEKAIKQEYHDTSDLAM